MAEADVTAIRKILGEIGRQQHLTEEDEILLVANSDTVYADYQDLIDVIGVYLSSDPTHAGTNYYTGGSFDYKDGIITLGTTLPPHTEVIVSYVRKHGLTDAEIDVHYEGAKLFLAYKMVYFDYEWDNPTEDLDKLAIYTAYNVAVYYCIITLNMGNLVMSGFNYRMEEFEIQTKLWGEGMIAQELFGMVRMRVIDLMEVLGANTGAIKGDAWGLSYLSGYPSSNVSIRRALARSGDMHIG